jgi:hypothetical protein
LVPGALESLDSFETPGPRGPQNIYPQDQLLRVMLVTIAFENPSVFGKRDGINKTKQSSRRPRFNKNLFGTYVASHPKKI